MKHHKLRTLKALGAFSLVELLVVVAVIALLATLLFPALSRAKELSRATACASNVRQIGIASVLYAADFNDKLPYFRDWLCSRPGDLSSGTLYPYLRSKPVYLCAKDKRDLDIYAGTKETITAPSGWVMRNAKRDYSYAMNCGICHVRSVGQWTAPSETVMYMEGRLGLNDYTGQVGPVWVSRSLATRHEKRGNLLFGDLHVERLGESKFDNRSKIERFWYPTDDPTLRKSY